MEILQGTGASQGSVLGRIKIIRENPRGIEKRTIENVAAEIERFNKAVEVAKENLGILY